MFSEASFSIPGKFSDEKLLLTFDKVSLILRKFFIIFLFFSNYSNSPETTFKSLSSFKSYSYVSFISLNFLNSSSSFLY